MSEHQSMKSVATLQECRGFASSLDFAMAYLRAAALTELFSSNIREV
jgi:hypothetical protein